MRQKLNHQRITQGISSPRLTHFKKRTNTETMREYAKNIRLAEATYPILQQLEIVLRNQWEAILVNKYGLQWYQNTQFQNLLDQIAQKKLNDAILEARKNRQFIQSGHVVSELTFGFWTSLLGRRYEIALWRPYSHLLFPNCQTQQRNIQSIRDDLTRIRKLRNRVAHHEPINKQPLELWQRYETIVKLLEWMNSDVRNWLRSSRCDRFPTVFNSIFHPKPRKKKTP
jgi:hypothetical protein